MKTYILANWKMNLPPQGMEAMISQCIAQAMDDAQIALFPPAPFLHRVAELIKDSPIGLGGQDCSLHADGAYTGDTSAGMLKFLGAQYVLSGHSERRAGHHETSEQVRGKAQMALQNGLTPVICIGENLEQRLSGEWKTVIARQIEHSLPSPSEGRIIIAYEPIWAIGTGKIPTLAEIGETHKTIASLLPSATPGAHTPILYGGSVSDSNAASILGSDGVDGVLVGGASLDSKKFCAILDAARRAKAG